MNNTSEKRHLILGPPRSGTTILLRHVSGITQGIPISEPSRVWHNRRRNIIPDAILAEMKSRSTITERIARYRDRHIHPVSWLKARSLPSIVLKETTRFHVHDDPVNADILSMVLSDKYKVTFTIRHPAAICHSVFYRFRERTELFTMDLSEVEKLVVNVNIAYQFATAFNIPLIRYEDWTQNPEVLHDLLGVSGSIMGDPQLLDRQGSTSIAGIGDADAISNTTGLHINSISEWRNKVPENTQSFIYEKMSQEVKELFRSTRDAPG